MTLLTKYVKQIALHLILILIIFLLPLKSFAALEEAIFAGGCFWCLEHDLEKLPGIAYARSGYTGGNLENPTYREVGNEDTGHQESVIVEFDNKLISYEDILRNYWRNIDPTDGEGQFCDRGDSYRPVIFYIGENQQKDAYKSFGLAAKELSKSPKELKVQIKELNKFWLAEDYHQDYALRNSLKYNFYRYSCGRDLTLDRIWGDKARTGQPWSK